MLYESYILKTWATTIIIAPVLLMISWSLFWWEKIDLVGSIEMYFLMVIMGSIYSIPATFCLWLINHYGRWKAKTAILCLSAVISIFVTFYLVDEVFVSNKMDQVIWPIIYAITMVAALLIYKPSKLSES